MPGADKTALTGGWIVDVVRGTHRKGTLLLEEGKIAAVLPAGTEAEGYRPVEAAGKYIMPGLIEMHGHFYGRATAAMKSQHEAYLPLYLAGGVTTVRTPGEFEPDVTLAWKREIDAGRKTGPRILSAGSYFDRHPSIVGWIEGSATLEELVRKYARGRDQMDFVKVYSHTPPQWIKVLADLAHSDGMKIYGHLGASATADAILAGIDGVEHGFYTMSEFYGASGPRVRNAALAGFDPDGEEASRVIELICGYDVAVTPTTVTFGLAGKPYSDWVDAVDGWRYLTPEGRENHRARRAEMDADEEEITLQNRLLEKQYRFVNRIYKNRGRIFCGTDPSYPLIVPGYAIVQEARNLRRCGMSNEDILRALTWEAAKELGLERIIGSITRGKEADLIILGGDPLANIDALSTVETVYKAGVPHDPKSLRESAAGKIH